MNGWPRGPIQVGLDRSLLRFVRSYVTEDGLNVSTIPLIGAESVCASRENH